MVEWRGGPGVPRAPAGGLGWPRGGPRWTGHVHRRSEATAAGDYSAPSVVLDGEHEHGVQEREAKLMALLVRSDGAERGKTAAVVELRSSAMAGETARGSKGRERGRASEPERELRAPGLSFHEHGREVASGGRTREPRGSGARPWWGASSAWLPHAPLWGISQSTWQATTWPH